MQLSFWDHLGEFRSRLLKIVLAVAIATGIAFGIADWLLAWLLKPSPLVGKSLTALQPAAVFIQSLRLSLIGGVVLSLPVIFYQIWAFIAPGLSKREAKAFILSLYAGTGLFALGGLFAYFYVIPAALGFFWSYSERLAVIPAWTIDHYINFVLMFLVSFGLAFELPLVVILLVWLKIISPQTLVAKRPYIIVGLAILAAILTPPDVVSQILLLVPLWLLFEISLFVAKKIS